MLKRQLLFFLFAAMLSIHAFSANPPTIYDIYPGELVFTSETSFPIVLYLYDDIGIDAAKIQFEYQNILYNTGNANVTWVSPIVTFTHPTPGGNYTEGEHVLRLLDCQDTNGNQVENLPYVVTFNVDTTAPTVTDLFPGNGEQAVNSDSKLELHFSDPMDPDTVGNSIKIFEGNSEMSKGTYSFLENNTILILNPELKEGKIYTVRIRTLLADSSNSLKNIHGKILTENTPGYYDYSFGDTNSPTVVTISPTSGSKLRAGESIYVYFSEKMNTNSVEANIILNQNVKTYEWDANGTKLEIIMNSTIYEKTSLEIGVGSQDLSGNGFAVKYNAEFQNLNVTNVVLVNSYPSPENNSLASSDFYCRLHFNINFNPADILSSAQILGEGTESSKVINFDSYLVSATDAKIITLYLTDKTQLSENSNYIIRIPAGTLFSDGIISQQDIEINFTSLDVSSLQGSVFRLAGFDNAYFITVYDGNYIADPTVPQFWLQDYSGGLLSISLQTKVINDRKIYYGYYARDKENQKILAVKGKYTEEMRLY